MRHLALVDAYLELAEDKKRMRVLETGKEHVDEAMSIGSSNIRETCDTQTFAVHRCTLVDRETSIGLGCQACR